MYARQAGTPDYKTDRTKNTAIVNYELGCIGSEALFETLHLKKRTIWRGSLLDRSVIVK